VFENEVVLPKYKEGLPLWWKDPEVSQGITVKGTVGNLGS